MKKAACLAALLALVLTSCGLKVKVSLVAGAENPQGSGATSTSTDGGAVTPTTGPNAAGGDTTGSGATGPSTGPVASAGSLFKNETEGVTKNQITICGHVPITGAAPIPHNPARFGQFYFDYVNKELHGVYGRNVKFQSIDDQYNPPGARQAVNQCQRQGAFIYFGAAGTDQIVSVAKWAEDQKELYFHGSTSDKDLHGFKYSVGTGPAYEFQSKLLADYLVKTVPTSPKPVFGMVRLNSPYFDSGHDAYVAELKKYGYTLADDEVVQKDSSEFTAVLTNMYQKGVTVINNFTTPTIWIKMLNQMQNFPTYHPLWTAVSPIAGFNIVAQALAGSHQNSTVFSSFNPACHCTYYNTDLDTSAKWYNDEKEFLRIFKKYSPEQSPPPDDFDYASYLGAKAIHRLLLKIGANPTRTKLWDLLKTYKETAAQAFPSCPGDFTRVTDELQGAWGVNVFTLDGQTWKQTHDCIDRWP
jgi:ABC-type branched-subunit amino acid transport system substrate-binding protein